MLCQSFLLKMKEAAFHQAASILPFYSGIVTLQI